MIDRTTASAETSARMKRVRQRGTAPELAMRLWLFKHGVRYRTNNRELPGSPDIANRRKRWAIFVHGCFWHGHPGCRRSRLPKSNTAFWETKIKGNIDRDARKAEQLSHLGFDVITIWECEVEDLSSREPSDESVSLQRRLLQRLRG